MLKNLILLLLFLFVSQPIAHANLRNGLVGWWRLDETSGNPIDSSGSGYTGSPTSTTFVSSCKRSNCLGFNGTSSYVTLGMNAFNTLTNNFSYSVWVFPNSVTVQQVFFSLGAGRAWGGIENTSKAAFQYFDGGNRYIYGATSLIINNWYNITVTKSSTDGVKVYLNGVLDGSDAGRTSSVTAYAGENAAIGGAMYLGVNQPFNGLIDDMRIYNRVLTEQEIADLYRPGIVLRQGVLKNGKFNQ